MSMKLYPAVLLGDFGTTKLADTITTAQRYRWSTSDATNFGLVHSHAQKLWDRRSLRIETTTSTGIGTDEEARYGLSGSGNDVDDNDIMNAFGNVVDDLTWCTNLACWLYHTNDKYNASDPDQFKFFMSNGGTDIEVYWPSSFDTTDKWIWVSDTPDAGSFASNGDNIEQWGFRADGDTVAWAAGYFYVNTLLAYRSTLSTAGDDYTFSNAIELSTSSYINTGYNTWRVTGKILGDRPVDLARQLHEMETLGLSASRPVRWPTPKYQALQSCDNISVYLMYQEETLGSLYSGTKTVTAAVPVVITNVQTEWDSPSKRSKQFSFDALRFAGV